MSKTLGDIVEAVKDGERPEYDELLYAVIALESLRHFNHSALLRLSSDKPSIINNAEYQAEESFRRDKGAMSTPPIKWVGWNHDPKNPDYQKTRKISKKLFTKVVNKVIAEDQGE